MTLFEEIKKTTLDRSAEDSVLEKNLRATQYRIFLLFQGGVLILAIVSASVLAFYDRLNPAFGLLIGSLVG